MKKILLSIFAASVFAGGLQAQTVSLADELKLADEQIQVSRAEVANTDGSLFISMWIDPTGLQLKSEHEVILTPVLLSKTEEQYLELPAITIAGRNRWLRYQRNAGSEDELRQVFRLKKEMEPIHYQTNVPYEAWMAVSELLLRDSRCGCMKKVLSSHEASLAQMDFIPKFFVPHFVYIRPEVKDKISEVSGSAYLDFPVNHTEIQENYRNNRSELEKIYRTIDQLKNDQYVSEIKSLTFKGFASPEGPYEGNVRLAEARTRTLVQHVNSLYDFPEEIIHTDFEAEDWEGLRHYVEQSDLSHKKEILEIIGMTQMQPDSREWRLKSTYPAEYRLLLRECYPALRHSDYTIRYSIKKITDLEEAKRLLEERPGILSPDEFYQIALSYEEGSEAYNEAFDIMVRVHSKDPVANLNAANVAMSRGDMVSARKFLHKAGNSAIVDYAKGIYSALEKNYIEARNHFETALDNGVEAAREALHQLDILENDKK